jgi:hypothetical protein
VAIGRRVYLIVFLVLFVALATLGVLYMRHRNAAVCDTPAPPPKEAPPPKLPDFTEPGCGPGEAPKQK